MIMQREVSQVRRKSIWRSRNAKFARMRAAKERIRLERLNAEPAIPDTSHVKTPRAIKAHVEIRVRVGDRWFCTSAYQSPWGGIFPSRTKLADFVRTTLLLA